MRASSCYRKYPFVSVADTSVIDTYLPTSIPTISERVSSCWCSCCWQPELSCCVYVLAYVVHLWLRAMRGQGLTP